MENIIDITECCICTRMFTDPRILPCIHTFCLECLEATRSNSESNSVYTMPCPICRQQFIVPPDGLSGLQKNFFMDRLMEIAKIAAPSQTNKVPCDVCLRNEDESNTQVGISDALKYCVECQENMCESCFVQHRRQKLLREHQIVPFGSQLVDEIVKLHIATYCKQHKKEELKMYCADCKTVICMMCFAECHKTHECSDVNRVADGFRDEVDVFIAKIVEASNEGLEKKLKLEKVKGNFLTELKATEEAIRERVNELKQLIDRHAKMLLDQLVQIKATRMKETENENEEIESYLAIFNSFNAYCREMKSKGTPVDICRSVDDLRTRSKELEEVNQEKIKRNTYVPQVSFKTSSIEDMQKKENIVGNLEGSAEVIKIIHFSSFVHAVAKLDDKMYVVCQDISQGVFTLCIFEDRDPFRNYKNVRITEIQSCTRVASSDKFRCLYILDFFGSCVFRLMVDDFKVTKWLSNLNNVISLSTSIDGFLMLLRSEKGLKKLETYEQDARISRSRPPISLSYQFVEHPIQFAQEANGKFIIIHNSDDTINPHWGITEMSDDGQILRQFKSQEKPSYFIDTPYLGLDSENDRLFVALTEDSELNLVIFDLESLEWRQSLLLSGDRSTRISSIYLHYDAFNRLLVFVSRSDKVEVYQCY